MRWEKRACAKVRWERRPAMVGRRWMEREPSGAVRRLRMVWCGLEGSGVVTAPASRGARRWKVAWAAWRMGEGEVGQVVGSARKGARKGSVTRVGSV